MAEEHPNTEAARKQLQADREASEKSRQEFAERTKGKPTPTQEENDLAALGAPVFDKEEDGSPPDPFVRSVESSKPGAYQTRAARPANPAPPHASQHTPRRSE